jgi:acetate kinase
MIVVIDYNLKKAEFQLFNEKDGQALKSLTIPLSALEDSRGLPAFRRELKNHGTLTGAAVRLRFGGDRFPNPTLVNSEFLSEFTQLTPAFPLFVSTAVAFLSELLPLLEGAPCYAFFETALFRDLPDAEKNYAIPPETGGAQPIRRFGFHGLTHEYHSAQLGHRGAVLSFVFDNTTTVCALRDGKPTYISVGYSPLEGVMGRTSCGDLDPGVVFYLIRALKESYYKIDNLLKKESGFYGLTGLDIDIGELSRHMASNPDVADAFEIYYTHLLKHAGEALAVTGGMDGVVFGGRFAKPLQPLILRLVKKLSFLGLRMKALPWPLEEPGVCDITVPESGVRAIICRTPLQRILYESLLRSL